MTSEANYPGPVPEDPHDLLAAWALDAVDDRERALVEQAIADDPALAQEARGLIETTAFLADSVATTPPPALRGEILAAIAREAAASGSFDDQAGRGTASQPAQPAVVEPLQLPLERQAAPAAPTRARRDGISRWQGFALAAAVAGALAVPTTLAVQLNDRAQQAEQQMAAIEEAMRQPGAQLLQGDVTGGGRAAAVLTGSEAVFTASDLPDPGAGRAYQLWRADGEVMVSAGVLEAHDGRAMTTVQADIPVEVLAVSIEPEGGSDVPTTDPIVILAG